MNSYEMKRRKFLKQAIAGAAVTSFPLKSAFSQTALPRLEWQDFKSSADYAPFINALKTMQANTNSGDRKSWVYWSNIHVSACPHGVPYFLAWHRGYLHYFQETIRQISGKADLMVPYWDYYKYATMPAEFTDPSTGNPLYVSGRLSTNVRSALTLTPFSSTYVNFQRGTTNAFETSIEYKPHGSFHNLIGGYMAKMNSPMDPIFWMHHGQIDRLWAAWVAAGAGRTMPARTDSYWSGNHTYRSDLTMARSWTYDTQTNLNYTYTNLSMPKSLPVAQSSPVKLVQFVPGQGVGRPANGNFPRTGPRTISQGRRSVGGARGVGLDEGSVTVEVAVETADQGALRSVLGRQQEPGGPSTPGTPTYRSVQVVLDAASVTGTGANGGYFYDVYLNLPASVSDTDNAYYLGEFGAFEIAAAQHHGGMITFPATSVLVRQNVSDVRSLAVSFVRVNGERFPRGRAINVNEVRVELSTDAAQ